MAGIPTREWTDWAFYNDGTESGSTIIGAENTNPTLELDTTYFFRVGIEETADNRWNNPNVRMEHNRNGGGWTAVGFGGSSLTAPDSANVADGDDTTQRITVGQFTWDSANNNAVEEGTSTCLLSIDPQSTGTELLYVFSINSAVASGGDTIEIRLWDVDNGDTLDVVNQTNPTITVAQANITETPAAGSLKLTGIAPTERITGDVVESIPNGVITLNGIAPTDYQTGDVVEPIPSSVLTLTGIAPIGKTPNQVEPIPNSGLTLTGFAPTDYVTGDVLEPIPSSAITLTGFAPTDYQTGHVRESIPGAGITLTSFAPLAAVSIENIKELIPSSGLSLNGIAPAVSTGNAVEPIASSSLNLTGIAPTTLVTGHVRESVPSSGITLTGIAPSDYQTGDVVESIPSSNLVLNGIAPTERVSSDNVIEQIPSGKLQLTRFAPVVVKDILRYIPSKTLRLTGRDVTESKTIHSDFCGEFQSAGSDRISQTDANFGSFNRQKFTISTWVTFDSLGAFQTLVRQGQSSGNFSIILRLSNTNKLQWVGYTNGTSLSSILTTTATYTTGTRYHVRLDYDSGNATSGNRVRLYVNGTRVTVFDTATYPALNAAVFDSTHPMEIGGVGVVGQYLNGRLKETAFVSGNNPSLYSFRSQSGGFKDLSNISGLKSWLRYIDWSDEVLATNWTTSGTPETIRCTPRRIPLHYVNLLGIAPSVRTSVIVEVARPTAGVSRRVKARKHRQIMIDGRKYAIDSPEQEYFLLQRFLDKIRNQYELDLQKKKTPQVKRKIKLKASMIKRTETRIDKVSEEIKWRQKIQREDEEILALLVA